MNETLENTKDSKKTGRLVLFILLGFFFTFAAVDAFFVYKAVSTHSGVVEQDIK